MAACSISNVKVLTPTSDAGPEPCRVEDDLVFEVTLDVMQELKEDLLFRCMYVTDSASGKDVELESIDVGDGPGVRQGVQRFRFESSPPAQSAIEASGGPLEVAGLYLSALYRGEEFCRVGYYVRHDYDDPALQEDPPATVDWARLRRVLSEPCVTKFQIPWDTTEAAHGRKRVREEDAGLCAGGTWVG
ncbi:ASF1 [Symbiodinium necroappetens]|uniref:ASF1 protein n=2 Tax=Symbiodinium TaxID=2949 RepID=A0A812QBS2_9DINO|nr:Histone chaperone ASF1 [Symbiodinium microadriaticum]CAE7301526.1 ASF1 [Symbiodinium microadriaticum]CAE7386603.1 ASF1 [Symbiodinium necroappetens]CAE7945450.1 ASF1 [Symbiodinium sp. KB8]